MSANGDECENETTECGKLCNLYVEDEEDEGTLGCMKEQEELFPNIRAHFVESDEEEEDTRNEHGEGNYSDDQCKVETTDIGTVSEQNCWYSYNHAHSVMESD